MLDVKIPRPGQAPNDYSDAMIIVALSPDWYALMQGATQALEDRRNFEDMSDAEYNELVDWFGIFYLLGGTLEAVKVRSSVNVNISAGVWTSINFDTEDFDDLGMHSSGNPSRLNAINNGDYLVIGQVGIQQGTGYFSVRILLNGTTELAHVIEQAATHDRSQNAVGRARLQAGDYVEIQVNSATALVLPASYLFFAMDRLK